MYKEDAHSSTDNIQYDETLLSDKGDVFTLEQLWMPTVDAWSPVYRDMLKPFDFGNYTAPRLPVDLGPEDLSVIEECPRILRLTIKQEGSLECRVPKELCHVLPMVKRLLNYEFMVNPNLKDFNVHLTLDYGKVKKGSTQRFPGWHGDGLQGGKFKEKLVCEHSYIASTKISTEICLQPFFVQDLDEDKYNLFKAFDQQAKECNVYETLPNHVYLMDPYVVHCTPLAKKTINRAFIRLTIANKELPIEFNTFNPMFNGEKHPYKLDIRDVVKIPDKKTDYTFYGLENKGNKTKIKKLKKIPQADYDFKKVELSGKGKVLDIPFKRFPIVQPYSPTYNDIHEPFNLSKYTNPRLPIDLGKTNLEAIKQCPNVLRMMLKWDNDMEVMLPDEFMSIKPLIERLFTYDQNINKNYKECAAHITIDNRIVQPNTTQRFPGFHGDDLQGGIFTPKILTAHSYIVTSDPATEVCLQPFFVAHLNDTYEKVFDDFDRQAREENIVSTRPDHVYLVDPYNVHRSPVITQPTHRVFLRITFSPKEMLLPHNSPNKMFDGRDYPGDNAIHLDESWFLTPSDRKIDYPFYGLKKLKKKK